MNTIKTTYLASPNSELFTSRPVDIHNDLPEASVFTVRGHNIAALSDTEFDGKFCPSFAGANYSRESYSGGSRLKALLYMDRSVGLFSDMIIAEAWVYTELQSSRVEDRMFG